MGPATARSDIRRNVIEGPGECPGLGKCTRREDSCIHVHVVHTSSMHARARLRLIQARMQECRRPRAVIPGEERTRGTESLERERECNRPLRVPDTRSSGKTLSRLASVRRVCPMNGLFGHLTLATLDARCESLIIIDVSWCTSSPALPGFHLHQLHYSRCFTRLLYAKKYTRSVHFYCIVILVDRNGIKFDFTKKFYTILIENYSFYDIFILVTSMF